MKRHLSLVLGLCGVVALATGACTSSGTNNHGQQDAGTGDAFHQFDGAQQQDGGGDSGGPATCTGTGHTAAVQWAEADIDNNSLFYAGDSVDSTSGSPYDRITVELYYGMGTDPLKGPGTITIGATVDDRNYATCTTCVRLLKGCTTGSGCTKTYLATEGTVNITGYDIGGNFTGTLSNVKLQEVTIASDYTSTPVTNGTWWCVDSYSFDAAIEGALPCSTNTDCPTETPLCDTDTGYCGDCLTNADCASKPAGQQICGAGMCGACASMLDCTSAGPICQISATTSRPECVVGPATCTGDDAGDPTDDGTSGARLLTVGVATNANICFADPNADDYSEEYDWYKIVTTAAGNITVTVAWTDSTADLDFVVVDSTLTEVDSAAGTTNPETLALTAQPAGTYYVGVVAYEATGSPAYTITYTTP